MTPAERLFLDTIRPFANATDSEWAAIESIVAGGTPVTALEGVAKTMVKDAMIKAERQSFGGNRSAAGAYAASVRWGNRGGSTSGSTGGNISGEGGNMNTDHGLKTDRPVQRTTRGELLVQQENGGWRAPTAGERGLPTSAEVKKDLKPELDELKSMAGQERVNLQRDVQTMLASLTSFQRSFDANGGSFGPKSPISSETHNKAYRLSRNVDAIQQRFGTWGTMKMSFDPQIVSVADRIAAKLKPVLEKALSLEQPAT